jgi:predicted regulator of Ras-like GTPase activity (Roadblock/LC7/MglB family)
MSWREVLARADRPTPPRERPGRSGRGAAYQDPDTLFDAVTGRGPIVGVLLLDASGLVLAGRLEGERRAEALGALIGAVAREGIRVARHLALGKWSGLLLDTEGLLLHVAPAGDGAALLVAARADAPIGWVLRAAGHAAEIAQRYVEADHE